MTELTGGAPATNSPSGSPAPAGGEPTGKPTSLWGDARQQLVRSPVFLACVVYLLIVGSMAFVPSLWTDKSPRDCDLALSRTPPQLWEHPFGVDLLGCDYYAQAVYGARPSLSIAVLATFSVIVVGGLVGLLAGYFGGWLDAVLSRIIDIFLSLPFLLGALVLLSLVTSRNVYSISLALIVLGWTVIARIMRGSVLEAKGLDYVSAARALGATNGRIMLKHILPNAVAPVVVYGTILLGGFVAAEATLTYLGVGLQPPTASWGVMIDRHQTYFDEDPWLLVFPVGLLVGTVLSFILAGDVLRDALDPKLQ